MTTAVATKPKNRLKGQKAPAAPKAKKPKPEMVRVDKLEWEHHQKCRDLAEEIEKDQASYEGQKKAAKELFGSISGKQVMLRRMIRSGPERLPLFDGPKPAATNGHATATPSTAPAPDADAWRKAPLKEAIFTPGNSNLTKGLNALQKAGIDTVGELEDRRAKGIKWTDGIANFGPEAQTAVEDAVTSYLERTRDKKVFEAARASANGNGHAPAAKKGKKATKTKAK